MSGPRKGDSCTASFAGLIVEVDGTNVMVKPIAGDGRVTLPVAAITVTTPTIVEGDTCLQTATGRIVTVLAIAGDEAWVADTVTGARSTPKLTRLQRQR